MARLATPKPIPIAAAFSLRNGIVAVDAHAVVVIGPHPVEVVGESAKDEYNE